MALPNSLIFWYGETPSVSRSWVQGQGHGSAKAVACNSKKLVGIYWGLIGRNICYDSARSNSELLTFWLWPWDILSYFSNSSSSFECLKLAASLLVWRYIFRISRLPSFRAMGLISRSRFQNSCSAQVCAPLGHSLIFVLLRMIKDIQLCNMWMVLATIHRHVGESMSYRRGI